MRATIRRVRGSIYLQSYLVTTLFMTCVGAILIFGPAEGKSSESFVIIRRMFPILVWGWLFIAASMVKMLAIYLDEHQIFRLGSLFGGMMSIGWAFGLTLAAYQHHNRGWTSIPAWLALGALQLLAVATTWSR